MILEALFFVVIVVLAIKEIRILRRPTATKSVTNTQKSDQLKKLEEYAARLYGQKQYRAAERAYLKVLKLNHRDWLAYNRLGLIYLALKNFDDAIECFQISAQINPTAASWYNLGSAYNENNNSIKAVSAIEKSIMFEATASRYIGLSRAYSRVNNHAKAIWSLEQAVLLEKSKKTLALLADAYAHNHEREKMLEVYKQVLELDPSDAKARKLVGTT